MITMMLMMTDGFSLLNEKEKRRRMQTLQRDFATFFAKRKLEKNIKEIHLRRRSKSWELTGDESREGVCLYLCVSCLTIS